MNHPELIAVPVLMLADYALTIVGAKSSAVVYRKHFAIESYELNPLWRKSVDQIRWFNPRHMAIVVLVTCLLVLIDQTEMLDDTFNYALGMLLGAFGSVCGRHLTNLILFHYLNRHPGEISGRVQLSMKLGLKISQFTTIGLIPLFVIVVALVPNGYTFGMLSGILAVVFAHFVWGRKTNADVSRQPKEAELVDTDA